MNDPLGNALMIKMRDLFAHDEIFQQRRSPLACLERILIVVDADSLICGEVLILALLGEVCELILLVQDLLFGLFLRSAIPASYLYYLNEDVSY